MTRRRVSDALTSFAAQTFPPSRRTDGRVVRDCARDAIESEGLRAMAREPLSLAVAGLRVRLGVARAGVLSAPWRAALATLPLLLAATPLCVWTFGFVPRYDHGRSAWGGSWCWAARWWRSSGLRCGPGDSRPPAPAPPSWPRRRPTWASARRRRSPAHLGNPYPFPELTESRLLITALGIALLVAVVWSWREARTRPEVALGTALVLLAVAHPLAWVLHGYAVWPHILVPLTVATALVLRAAARLESRPDDLRQGRRSRQA